MPYKVCNLRSYYETTLFSKHSNNRAYGEALFKREEFTKLAEGVSTAKAMMLLSEKYDVELPITQAVYNIIYLGYDPLTELLNLFSRTTKGEFV